MSLQFEERPANSVALGGLVFFHGRGGRERDVLPFLDVLDPERRLHGIAPRGPFAWAGDRAAWDDPDAPEADRDRAIASIGRWVDELPFPPERLVLAGWSQGAALAYALGLARGRPRAAAVLAFGGFLPDQPWFRPGAVWPLDLTLPLPPIAIVHGTDDEAVSIEQARRARELFTAAGANLFYEETSAGHWMEPTAIAAAGRFLEPVMPRTLRRARRRARP